MSEALHQAVNETVATKADLAGVQYEMAETRISLRQEIAETRAELRQDMVELRAEVRQDLARLDHRITELRSELKLWTGSLAAGLFAALSGMAAAMRFLGH